MSQEKEDLGTFLKFLDEMEGQVLKKLPMLTEAWQKVAYQREQVVRAQQGLWDSRRYLMYAQEEAGVLQQHISGAGVTAITQGAAEMDLEDTKPDERRVQASMARDQLFQAEKAAMDRKQNVQGAQMDLTMDMSELANIVVQVIMEHRNFFNILDSLWDMLKPVWAKNLPPDAEAMATLLHDMCKAVDRFVKDMHHYCIAVHTTCGGHQDLCNERLLLDSLQQHPSVAQPTNLSDREQMMVNSAKNKVEEAWLRLSAAEKKLSEAHEILSDAKKHYGEVEPKLGNALTTFSNEVPKMTEGLPDLMHYLAKLPNKLHKFMGSLHQLWNALEQSTEVLAKVSKG